MRHIAEKMLIEQMLNITPADVREWLSEKKPTTGLEVGRLTDNYYLVRKQNRVDLPRQNDKCEGMVGLEMRCHTCGQEYQEGQQR